MRQKKVKNEIGESKSIQFYVPIYIYIHTFIIYKYI